MAEPPLKKIIRNPEYQRYKTERYTDEEANHSLVRTNRVATRNELNELFGWIDIPSIKETIHGEWRCEGFDIWRFFIKPVFQEE